MDSNRRFDAAKVQSTLASLNKQVMAEKSALARSVSHFRAIFGSFSRAIAGAPRETYKPNGKNECERRRRQIAAGQLKRENGLVVD